METFSAARRQQLGSLSGPVAVTDIRMGSGVAFKGDRHAINDHGACRK
jgi:hypothetical protein